MSAPEPAPVDDGCADGACAAAVATMNADTAPAAMIRVTIRFLLLNSSRYRVERAARAAGSAPMGERSASGRLSGGPKRCDRHDCIANCAGDYGDGKWGYQLLRCCSRQ